MLQAPRRCTRRAIDRATPSSKMKKGGLCVEHYCCAMCWSRELICVVCCLCFFSRTEKREYETLFLFFLLFQPLPYFPTLSSSGKTVSRVVCASLHGLAVHASFVPFSRGILSFPIVGCNKPWACTQGLHQAGLLCLFPLPTNESFSSSLSSLLNGPRLLAVVVVAGGRHDRRSFP